jgi:hypothetical protein
MFVFIFLTLAAKPPSDPNDLYYWDTDHAQKPFVVKLIKPDANDSLLVKLQKERAHARALYLNKGAEVALIASWHMAYFFEYVEAERAFWDNLMELAMMPEDKLKCAETRVTSAKWFERFISTRVEAGAEYSGRLNVVKAARIDAEIDLLKLKEALKDKK